VLTCVSSDVSCTGTEQNHFGWKTAKITKFSILELDVKMEFTILDRIWTKNGQMATWKNCQSLAHSLALP